MFAFRYQLLVLNLLFCHWVIATDSTSATWTHAKKTIVAYCYECHGGFATDANLDLVNVDIATDLEAKPEKWMQVIQALRTHYMPHPDGQQMPITTRKQLIEKLQSAIVSQAETLTPQSASLRRLNRTEFSNTLNDLFLVKKDWTQSLPADDAGYGFDNIASALSFSPLLLERYFDAASKAALVAIPQTVKKDTWKISADSFRGRYKRSGIVTITSKGPHTSAKKNVFFPANGQYEIEVRATAQQAGGENARAQLWLDNQYISEGEIFAPEGSPPTLFRTKISIHSPGDHKLEIRLAKDFFKEDETGKQDRNLLFHSIRITGPEQTSEDLRSPFLDRHFGSIPENLSFEKIRDGIERFASRAYRRPLSRDEINSLWEIFETNLKSNEKQWDVRNGLYAVVEATLTSPTFLFRWETLHKDSRATSFALASWLSYFLWSSMPDDRLFELAQSQKLRPQLKAEVLRMLQDPKANALATNFAGQWWRYRDLDIHKPDLAVYEGAHPRLLRAMKEETRLLFSHIMRFDGSLIDFLSADYTFINQALAEHYGIEGVKGPKFRKVSLQETQRRGVWSHAGILTITSYPNHTSPVLRGQWILENLIGLSPPPPPDNIPSLPGTDGKPDPQDLRANLALHRENPDCASCHDIMDPIGLALEHFDGIGRMRPLSERNELSPETLFDGTTIKGPADLAQYLRTERADDFIQNIAHKLSIYASGRGLDWRDEAAIQRIAQTTHSNNHRFSSLIYAVVEEFAPKGELISFSEVKKP